MCGRTGSKDDLSFSSIIGAGIDGTTDVPVTHKASVSAIN